MTVPRFMIHFCGPSLTVHTRPHSVDSAVIYSYGQELLVTPDVIMANSDVHGRCALLEMLDDEPAQLARFGRVAVRRGPWPEALSRLDPGSSAWSDARESARQDAHRILDPQARERALCQVRADYGDAPTSQTLATYRR